MIRSSAACALREATRHHEHIAENIRADADAVDRGDDEGPSGGFVVHAALIALHATTGLVALLAGALCVRRRSYLPLYFGALVSCIAFLGAAVAVGWSGLSGGTRVLFVAFLALGAFMIWRGARARGLWPADAVEPSARYFDHLGFTLVALTDAFVVIAVLDLGAPGWVVAVIGVLGAAIGHRAIQTLKQRPSGRTS